MNENERARNVVAVSVIDETLHVINLGSYSLPAIFSVRNFTGIRNSWSVYSPSLTVPRTDSSSGLFRLWEKQGLRLRADAYEA
jgi:hypothetical protein